MNFKQQFKPDLRRMRNEGFKVAINCQIDSGPTLTVTGIQETAEALSNCPKLAQYAQIEIKPSSNGMSTFIGTDMLLNKPQLIIGFPICGFPILLGVRSMEGNLTILGPTRTGTSLTP